MNAGLRATADRERKTTAIIAEVAMAVTTGRKRATMFVRAGRVTSGGAATTMSADSNTGGGSRAGNVNSTVAELSHWPMRLAP